MPDKKSDINGGIAQADVGLLATREKNSHLDSGGCC